MSVHSYSRCWLHMVWSTLNRKGMFDKDSSRKLSNYLTDYARRKGIYMRINYVNCDHVHVLIDLPTNLTIENAAQLMKGNSSHWVNENGLLPGRFGWGRGYGVFSVSHSLVEEVGAYIANQEAHHRVRSFTEELKLFVEKYGLKWRDESETNPVGNVMQPTDDGQVQAQ